MSRQPNPTITRRALLTGAAATGVAGLLAACSGSTTAHGAGTSATKTTGAATPASSAAAAGTTSPSPSVSATAPTAAAVSAREVTVRSQLDDGTVVGVGMPIVLTFEPAPTDAAAFVAAAKVTVDGRPANGAWHWSKPYAGQPIQAHYRTQDYWPANATIKLELPIGGVAAGKGLAYSGALTSLTLRTGDKRVTTVNGKTERATVMVNDKLYRTMKASLGKSSTPTTTGTKLVMQKGEDVPGTHRLRANGAVRMQNTAHTYDLMVDWSVRVTQSGEYLHAAPWNSEIGQVSTSDGCTNLSVADAKWNYNFSRVGDVVVHEKTGGSPIQLWDGYTDWNVPWSTWQKGGLLAPT